MFRYYIYGTHRVVLTELYICLRCRFSEADPSFVQKELDHAVNCGSIIYPWVVRAWWVKNSSDIVHIDWSMWVEWLYLDLFFHFHLHWCVQVPKCQADSFRRGVVSIQHLPNFLFYWLCNIICWMGTVHACLRPCVCLSPIWEVMLHMTLFH